MFNPPVSSVQNAYYNGWLSGTFCSSVFVFTPDGCIAFAGINYPGSWHDSALTHRSGLYSKICSVPVPFNIITDSAFSMSDDVFGKILRARKEEEQEHLNRHLNRDAHQILYY